MDLSKVKLVIVGDGACGKTSILIVYSRDEFPEDHLPTVFDTYIKPVNVDGNEIDLALWDTAGQEEFDRLRPLSYPKTEVVLICFSIDNPMSLENVVERWSPEIKHFCPNVPFILVGNKSDIRNDRKTIEELKKWKKKPVTSQEGHDVARQIGAHRYMECSAKMNDGIADIFKEAIKIALTFKKRKSGRPSCVLL
ncbi:hypothetical protein FSP39_002196 [Pinctada imbricata]|uniref:Ras-like GTP-binding protein Rho1 n=1 Tax=Pinctada imbricata TaxID=66713 RepID=A0AA88XPF0_PINIB|nr:hypothetical protein FSP39_002196 [Pinctada imbricata]